MVSLEALLITEWTIRTNDLTDRTHFRKPQSYHVSSWPSFVPILLLLLLSWFLGNHPTLFKARDTRVYSAETIPVQTNASASRYQEVLVERIHGKVLSTVLQELGTIRAEFQTFDQDALTVYVTKDELNDILRDTIPPANEESVVGYP
ncbi:hypothetical protein B0O80DRAFT_421260 [Mortierella sp. GBAus27b]|nr:hypothetical protein B0O80DRAFT_421260 [Mortierella sp. GBAus27b]